MNAWGGSTDQWEQCRVGLSFAAAWMRCDEEGLSALTGAEQMGPETHAALQGLVALTVAWVLNTKDFRCRRDSYDPDDPIAVAEFLSSYCAELLAE